MFRHIFASSLVLFIVSVSQSFADVTYSYMTDSATYTGVPGTPISVQLYLQETITVSGTDITSLINRTFATDKFNSQNLYRGISSVGVAVEQTGLSAGGTPSIIGTDVIVTPTAGSYNGVGNTSGFTFAPNFQYMFTQNTGGGNSVQLTGGGPQSILYQDVNDANGADGNNLQVKAAFNSNGLNSTKNFNKQNGVVTNGAYDSGSDTYASGMILIGTLHIYPGSGTTTFSVVPLGGTNMTNPSSSSFNTLFEPGSRLSRHRCGTADAAQCRRRRPTGDGARRKHVRQRPDRSRSELHHTDAARLRFLQHVQLAQFHDGDGRSERLASEHQLPAVL